MLTVYLLLIKKVSVIKIFYGLCCMHIQCINLRQVAIPTSFCNFCNCYYILVPMNHNQRNYKDARSVL